MQVEVADNWLTLMGMDEGDEWPEEYIQEETDMMNKCSKQSEWMNNYLDALDDLDI